MSSPEALARRHGWFVVSVHSRVMIMDDGYVLLVATRT
jgi:hypothetical protein